MISYKSLYRYRHFFSTSSVNLLNKTNKTENMETIPFLNKEKSDGN